MELVAKAGRCEEASILSSQFYIPCNAPATVLVKSRDERPYRMCPACASHNVHNRGAEVLRDLTPAEKQETAVPETIDDLPLEEDADLPMEPEAELALDDDELPLDEGGDERERIVPRGLSPRNEALVAEVLRDLEAVAPIVEILPAGFPLPTLIKFVPNEALKHAVDVALAYAMGIEVKGPEQLVKADAAVGVLREKITAIKAHFEEPARIADQLHKSITSCRAEWIREGEAAVKTVGTRIATENRRLEDAAAAARRREQAAADEQARQEARQRADQAAKDKAPVEVVETLQRQVETTRAEPVAPTPATTAPTLAHNSIVTTWKTRFVGTAGDGDEDPHPEPPAWTDLHRSAFLTLLKAIVEGKAPMLAVSPNWSYLDDRAVGDKKMLAIPGIEAFPSSGARARSRRR